MSPPNESELQDKLDAVTRALQRAEERVLAGQYALEIMHEVRGPLEALANLIYLTAHEAGQPDKVVTYMRIAEEQIGVLNEIASRTLAFGRSPTQAQPTELVFLTEAAIRIHKRAIDAKQVNLVRDFPGELTASVHSVELLQVLSNIIVNALDALPLAGTLSLRLRRSQNEVHFLIADNGHGIPREHMSAIFEPFFTTKEDRGNGLGLALSKNIIERHHGRIRLRSCTRPGRSGTSFRITLPAIHSLVPVSLS